MKNSKKSIAVTLCFCMIVGFLSLMTVYRYFNPVDTSETERRPLAQFPQNITAQDILDRRFMEKYEMYSKDQFPFREFFRTLKADFQYKVLHLKENNGLASEKGYFAKIEPEFSDATVDYSLKRLEYVYESYLKNNGGDKYFCLIPDKNYFFKKDFGYPGPDYEAMKEKAEKAFPDMTHIDIFNSLTLEDYYRTDTHWKQEKLNSVLKKLGDEMGFGNRLSYSYTEHTMENFAGVYYGQSAVKPKKDTLTYLTNDILDSCTVYDYESGKTEKLYAPEKFNGTDGYDVYLHGARALMRIDNPLCDGDKELVIFRDSFGSSLSPLIAEGYKTVYVADIRYISPDRLGDFVDFQNKDVLFIYSALILNNKAFK